MYFYCWQELPRFLHALNVTFCSQAKEGRNVKNPLIFLALPSKLLKDIYIYLIRSIFYPNQNWAFHFFELLRMLFSENMLWVEGRSEAGKAKSPVLWESSRNWKAKCTVIAIEVPSSGYRYHPCAPLSIRGSHPHTALRTAPRSLAIQTAGDFAAVREVVRHVLSHGMNFGSLCWESATYLLTAVSKIKQITGNYSSDLCISYSLGSIRRFADSTCRVNFISKTVPLQKETSCHKPSGWQAVLSFL